MTRYTRLRQTQNACQLGHVQPLAGEQAEQPEPRLVAKQPVQRGGLFHVSSLSGMLRGQSSFRSRERARSASRRPFVWQIAQ